ncbi:MAG: hypothetical protein HOV81_44360 [Kofleriaceae bacterium]|nr:hypothetical protein [Kofleriaceae bacterium]
MNRLHLFLSVVSLAGCVSLDQTGGADDDGAMGKADGASSALFGASGPSELVLEAPLAPAFKAARAGEPDGIFPLPRKTDPFMGKIGYGDVLIDAELQLRGNSSLAECPFPKLKAKADKAQAAGTMFDGARKIKIATHCGEGGNGTIGRLREEKATWREAALYQAMRALMMPSQLAKPLSITYRDTTTSEKITRKAFIFEHVDLAAGRLGGTSLESPETWEGDPAQVMDMQAIVRVHFFEALVGNWDWHLRIGASKPGGGQLWNIEAVQLGDKLVPLAQDFDLSSAVTGNLVADDDIDPKILPGKPPLVRQAGSYLASEYGPQFSDSELHAARDHFTARRAALEQALADAPVDDEGRANLSAHVAAFYEALDHLDEIMAAVR